MAISIYQRTIQQFETILQSETIDLERLRVLAFNGCPTENSIRSLTWKVLLTCLPVDRTSWPSVLERRRKTYGEFIHDTIIEPTYRSNVVDHPLNLSPSSSWSAYFEENKMLLQIDKDVRRLCPDLAFFQNKTEYPCIELLNQQSGFESLRARIASTSLKVESQSQSRLTGRVDFQSNSNGRSSKSSSNDDEYRPLTNGSEAHWEVVERILFVYSKLNVGQGYVQGMNEIIGPIYYTFATDPNIEWRKNAEADTFYCFTNLMTHIRDSFMKVYDHSEFGILGRMERFLKFLKRFDPEVHDYLEQQELKPEFYAFRWITLLFSQEFHLPDVLRIWDSLFADQEKSFEFIFYICCAMVILQRDQLLVGSFAQNIKLLQHYPPETDVHQILEKAAALKHRPSS